MKKVKSGKEEIIYLLKAAIEHFQAETGQEIVLNTNRKNYEALAIVLSNISNQLPNRFEEWGTQPYTPSYNQSSQEYPYRKYDITGGQIKDALSGIVSNPRPFLIDACYVYLFGMGRKAFEANPVDEQLLEMSEDEKKGEASIQYQDDYHLKAELAELVQQKKKSKQKVLLLSALLVFFAVVVATLLFLFIQSKNDWVTTKKDMNLYTYQPTTAEIDSLEGIWLCYTGSPQARISDANRYHKVVSNLVEVKYKKGYFTYNRFGASFDHIGHMQYESPGVVSVFSKVKSITGKNESPRHSLLNLNTNNNLKPAISASWSFDVGENNKIIGIREVYIKLGKGGQLEEVINELENASCQCKIVRWHQPNKAVKTFYLKNELLDSISNKELIPLINEKSILLSEPETGLIIEKDSVK
ncbi:MAG: hypothetical protein MUE72_05420 [Chitinophagaceae bacterium]|jgi:hypothetical protein|nr:hypothetical protein [Chitinophagaceae bacterium]